MKTWGLCLLLLVEIACGGTPIAPSVPTPPAPALTLDSTTLVIGRNETGQLHASYGLPGTLQDVTSAATWTSSAPQVATVLSGVVTAMGLGTASVTSVYQGQTKTATVTVRRRMLMMGTITLTDVSGRQTLVVLRSYVDDQNVGYTATSHALVSLQVRWDKQWGFITTPNVQPGSQTVSVDVPEQTQPPNMYVSDPSSHVDIIDADSSEPLTTIALPPQQKALSPADKMIWTVQVPIISS